MIKIFKPTLEKSFNW